MASLMYSGWSAATGAGHGHGPRRSQDQNGSRKEQRSSSPDATTEPRRRSSSDVATTPRQTPAPSIRFLSTTSAQDSNKNILSSPISSDSPVKRLGFFTEKLSSSISGTSSHQKSHSPNSTQLLYPHRTEPSVSSAAPASATMSNPSKAHTSPSKASYGRTYDSKLVSREMHRLGNLAHLPAGLAPALAATPSVSMNSLNLPAPGTMAQVSMASTSSGDPWGALHVHVLPLFNGEPLRIPIEDLNVLVKRHISAVVSSAPSKALATLENDAAELIASGMVTLNAKLMGLEDDKLVGRVVEIWGFFWDQVLTYVEGVLLPLQTDPLLSSLYRTPKRPSSPSRSNGKGSMSTLNGSLQMSPNYIDVRTVALRSFRDRVILPLSSRLYTRLSMSNRQDNFQETSYQQPRLQQMLLVLASQGRQRAPAMSLTSPPPLPTAGETAISDLLCIVRSPRNLPDARIPTMMKSPPSRTPGFLSGGRPRDRRGRIQQKSKGKGLPHLVGVGGPRDVDEDDLSGDETPRNVTGGLGEMERERERVMLEALRSPDLDSSNRASVGGWGLGVGREENGKPADDEEEDEPLDWDQAQAVVERMVGMNSQPETRRRMT